MLRCSPGSTKYTKFAKTTTSKSCKCSKNSASSRSSNKKIASALSSTTWTPSRRRVAQSCLLPRTPCKDYLRSRSSWCPCRKRLSTYRSRLRIHTVCAARAGPDEGAPRDPRRCAGEAAGHSGAEAGHAGVECLLFFQPPGHTLYKSN